MDEPPSRRVARDRTNSTPYDLVAVVALAGLAEVLAFVRPPMPLELRLVVFVPMLLFVPGYAVVAALFPASKAGRRETADGGVDTFERVVLGVVVSVGIAVVSGVVVDFLGWSIDLPTVVMTLLVPTVLGVVAAAVRRRALPSRDRFDYGLGRSVRRWRSAEIPRSTLIANGLVAVAILVVAASVLHVAAVTPRGETPTEFYEVSANGSGDPVAGDYPTEFVEGESTALHLRVANHEGESVRFAGVVTLQRVGPDGRVRRQATLDRFAREVPADATLVVNPTVTPPFTGERVRLTMLLYRGEIPANPTTENAYREIHRWVTVNASGQASARSVTRP